jgi:hypothetical protein
MSGAMTERDNSYDLSAEGEGFAALAADGGWDVGMTGRENRKIGGVGDSSPLAGKNPQQTIRDPAWLIFGHELCGHVRLGGEHQVA